MGQAQQARITAYEIAEQRKAEWSVPPVADGKREQLFARLDRCIALADRHGRRMAAATARDYRANLADGPIGYALYRHFSTQICDYIEGRCAADALLGDSSHD